MNAPVRILLVSTPVGALGTGAGGGVELTVQNTAHALSARGHDVTVLAPHGSVAEGVALVTIDGDPPVSADENSWIDLALQAASRA